MRQKQIRLISLNFIMKLNVIILNSKRVNFSLVKFLKGGKKVAIMKL